MNMKKLKFLILPITCIILISTCFTTVANSTEYYYEDKNITVKFSSDSKLSYEKRQLIADGIVYGYFQDNNATTYSWCWLVGHDLSADAVTTIEHKVDVLEPRCIERIYKVETCSACDYINETLESTIYIYCCPED